MIMSQVALDLGLTIHVSELLSRWTCHSLLLIMYNNPAELVEME